MSLLTLATATDLAAWADRRDAQAVLPQLIRRLVHATGRVTRVGFPAGEGVQLAGLDGIVLADEATAFVPEGISVWELGTSRRVKEKADGDYEKRRRDPQNVEPSDSVFVFVTPRRWGTRDTWVADRKAEGVWREVRCYTADDLEAWLEQAPAVHIWFSILIGKQPDGVIDIGNYWADWVEATRPVFTPDFVLAGRSEVVSRVHKWLREASGTLAIKAESREEALAVFAAALLRLPSEEQVTHLARSVVIQDRAAWDQLVTTDESLILTPLFDTRDVHTRATRRGHRVVVPLGRSDSAFPTTLDVPAISKEDGVRALLTVGLTEDLAKDIVALARRSLTACRRTLSLNPEVQQPGWARPNEARSLLPIMFAGAWDGGKEGDRDAMTLLAGTPYREITTVLVRWSNESDPPVHRIGDAWFIVSREDSWLLLGRYLVRDDLELFEEIVLQVLGTPDPRFDLPEQERWMANALGRGPSHSDIIREGLSETIAYLGARGDRADIANGLNPADYAIRIVKRLLERANRDWRVWASLSRVMPLLAEAAPGTFLDAVEAGLQGEQPILMLFKSEGDALFSSSPHTGLLWALETLAWSPDHLGRAAIVLAKLARVDPGGTLQNRPANSLREIFLLWYPNSAASVDQRMRVLDTIRRTEPEVAWRLLRELLPKTQDVGHNNPKPRWRDWAPESPQPVTVLEHFRAVHEVVARALEDVGTNGLRWSDLIEVLAALPASEYRLAMDQLSNLDPTRLVPDDRGILWNALRRLVSQHRSFADAGWALPRESLEKLAELLPRFEPNDANARYSWLFGNMPSLPEGHQKDHEKYQLALIVARQDAVRRIYAQEGLNALLELSASVERPYDIGATLGQMDLCEGAEADQLLGSYLASDIRSRAAVAYGFAQARAEARGREWGEALLIDVARRWEPPQRAAFCAALPLDERTWNLVNQCDRPTQQEYWQRIAPYGIPRNSVEYATRKFLEFERPLTAIELLWFYAQGGPSVAPELIAEVLEQSLTVSWKPNPPGSSFTLFVSTLLDQLDSSDGVDVSRLAALEWKFLPLVGRHERAPKVLHRALAEDPDFFATIVSYVFRAEGDEQKDVSEEEQIRARLGYELLESWRTVPGSVGQDIDGRALNSWIHRARTTMARIGRAVIGDERIGQMLAGSPADADGIWPHRAVRDALEELSSPPLERGFQIAVYNSRGVSSRSMDAGGNQERMLAEQYTAFAASLADQWPRTAEVLRGIAAYYRAEARTWDQETALREERETGPARVREREWLRVNLPQLAHLAGKWVAVEGTEIVAQGDDAASVADAARERGISSPFLYRIPPPGGTGNSRT